MIIDFYYLNKKFNLFFKNNLISQIIIFEFIIFKWVIIKKDVGSIQILLINYQNQCKDTYEIIILTK